MMHDLFIPCRIGNYYLHTKKVLTIEVTPVVVYGLLFEYSAKKIILKEKYAISLKENNNGAQISAVKKIISSAGKIDEIVSVCTTQAMVFKKLQLPFLGRDNIAMVLPLEIENMLPFSLDQAVIDFIIVHEDKEKKISTLLVCAVRKQDVDEQYDFFKKADISIDVLTVDVFALYRLYQIYIQEDRSEKKSIISKISYKEKLARFMHRIFAVIFRKKVKNTHNYSEQLLQNIHPNRAEILVDIGYNTIKILYIKDAQLHNVRVIPFGIGQGIETLAGQNGIAYSDIITTISSDAHLSTEVSDQFKKIFDEISKTLLYFQQQEGFEYVSPFKISLTGFFTNLPSFMHQAQLYFGSIISSVNMQECIKRCFVNNNSKKIITSEEFTILSCALSWHYQKENNLLQNVAQKKELHTVTVQLIVMFLTSVLALGIVWWHASQELQRWTTGYNVSRKELLKEIQNQMGLDVHGEKNLKTLVEKTEEVLKRERQLWFSFTQKNEASILEYLQDLSVAIDREAIGLDLKSLYIDYQKVVMTGTIKTFEGLDIFYEELQGLKLLKLVDRPRELSWTIELKPKVVVKGTT